MTIIVPTIILKVWKGVLKMQYTRQPLFHMIPVGDRGQVAVSARTGAGSKAVTVH